MGVEIEFGDGGLRVEKAYHTGGDLRPVKRWK